MGKWFVGGLASLCLSLVAGCGGENPGEYGLEETRGVVERQMAGQGIDVTTIDLAPKAGGAGFTGTAIDRDGQNYTVDVVQRAESKRLDFTATGDRGDIVEGFAAP